MSDSMSSPKVQVSFIISSGSCSSVLPNLYQDNVIGWNLIYLYVSWLAMLTLRNGALGPFRKHL